MTVKIDPSSLTNAEGRHASIPFLPPPIETAEKVLFWRATRTVQKILQQRSELIASRQKLWFSQKYYKASLVMQVLPLAYRPNPRKADEWAQYENYCAYIANRAQRSDCQSQRSCTRATLESKPDAVSLSRPYMALPFVALSVESAEKVAFWHSTRVIQKILQARDQLLKERKKASFSQGYVESTLVYGALPVAHRPDPKKPDEWGRYEEFCAFVKLLVLRNSRPARQQEDLFKLTACCHSTREIIHSKLPSLSSWQQKAVDLCLSLANGRELPLLRTVRTERVEAICSVSAALIARMNGGYGMAGWFHRKANKWANTSTNDLAILAGLYDYQTGRPIGRFFVAWKWLVDNGYVVSKRPTHAGCSVKAISQKLLRDFGHLSDSEIAAFKEKAAKHNAKRSIRYLTPDAIVERADRFRQEFYGVDSAMLDRERKKGAKRLKAFLADFVPESRDILIRLLIPPTAQAW